MAITLAAARDLVADDAAEAHADVAVDQEHERQPGRDRGRHRGADAGGERMEPRMRRIAAPREGERHRAGAFRDIGLRRARRGTPAVTAPASTCSPRSRLKASTGRFCSGRSSGRVIAIVLPLICTENCAAPITVARMPWPGSQTGGRSRRCASMWRERARELETEIAERPLLALVEIFGDAAREGEGVDAEIGDRGRPGVGHQEARASARRAGRRSIMRMISAHHAGDQLARGRPRRAAPRAQA